MSHGTVQNRPGPAGPPSQQQQPKKSSEAPAAGGGNAAQQSAEPPREKSSNTERASDERRPGGTDAKKGASESGKPLDGWAQAALAGKSGKPEQPKRDAERGAGDFSQKGNGPGTKHRDWFEQARAKDKPVVIAHRGDTEPTDNSPESRNTIESLENAARRGKADAVEMDIEALSDGTLVVYHDGDDEDIDDIHELDKADLADHPQIPTLREWSKRAGELNVNVLAEYKEVGLEGDSEYEKNARITEALDTLQKHVKRRDLVTMSFDTDVVERIKETEPKVTTGFLPGRDDDDPDPQSQVAALEHKPDFIEVADGDINDTVIQSAYDQNIGVLAGTSDATVQGAVFGDPRVQGVLTDYPTQARRERRNANRAVQIP